MWTKSLQHSIRAIITRISYGGELFALDAMYRVCERPAIRLARRWCVSPDLSQCHAAEVPQAHVIYG